MRYRLATAEDLDVIVELHTRVLNWSINGRLGVNHIHAMYEALFSGDDVFGCVAERDGRLVGFIVATTNYAVARSRFRHKIGLRGALRVLLSCWRYPGDWIDIAETATVVPIVMARSGFSAELLAWVTDPGDMLGRQAAVGCFRDALKEFLRRGHAKCLAQVLKPNVPPNKFHARLGSRVLASFFRNRIYLVDCEAKLG